MERKNKDVERVTSELLIECIIFTVKERKERKKYRYKREERRIE